MFREASGDFRMKISNLQLGMLGSGASMFHLQWLGSIKAARFARPWTRRASLPCAWFSCSSHGPAVCVCDRAIPAQHGLRDLTPHHTPGHLLLSLTQCAGKYSHNGQSNDRSWGSLPQKRNYERFLPSWFCQRVQLKCSLRWMQIHTISVTFAPARQECLPSLIMHAMQTIQLLYVSQRVQIVITCSLRMLLEMGHDGWLVQKRLVD